MPYPNAVLAWDRIYRVMYISRYPDVLMVNKVMGYRDVEFFFGIMSLVIAPQDYQSLRAFLCNLYTEFFLEWC